MLCFAYAPATGPFLCGTQCKAYQPSVRLRKRPSSLSSRVLHRPTSAARPPPPLQNPTLTFAAPTPSTHRTPGTS